MVKNTHEALREKRLRGRVDFPFELYEMKTEAAPIFVDCHWQEEMEILRIETGRVELLLDGVEIVLSPGDLAFINPGQMHQLKGLTADTRYYAYVFPVKALLFKQEDLAQLKLLCPLLEKTMGFPAVLSGDSPLTNTIRDHIDAIMETDRKRQLGYEIRIKAKLLEIICILGQNHGFVQHHSTRQNDVCKEILLYIQKHYAEKIAIRDIAGAVGLSENYFSAFFTRHLKRSFSAYLTEYRISQSCILLETTDLSVTDIALECGFSTASYYIQSFKNRKKLTPYQYRHRL